MDHLSLNLRGRIEKIHFRTIRGVRVSRPRLRRIRWDFPPIPMNMYVIEFRRDFQGILCKTF